MARKRQTHCSVCKTGPNDYKGKCAECRRDVQREAMRKKRGTVLPTGVCWCGEPAKPKTKLDLCLRHHAEHLAEMKRAWKAKNPEYKEAQKIKRRKGSARVVQRKPVKRRYERDASLPAIVFQRYEKPKPVEIPAGVTITRLPSPGRDWGPFSERKDS